MSLLTSYSERNLVIDSALTVGYSVVRINGRWEKITVVGGNVIEWWNSMFEMTRTARQTFRYVGMTKTAADVCKTAMVSKYTRSVTIDDWDWVNGEWKPIGGGRALMAEIAENQNDDGSYDVVVNVHETDVRMSETGSSFSLAVKFAGCQGRTYEGGETE